MTGLLLGLLIPVIIVGAIIFLAVRRGLQMRELCDQTPFHEKVVKLNIEIYFANFMLGAGLGLVGHWPWSH